MTKRADLTRTLMAQPMGYQWPDPTNDRLRDQIAALGASLGGGDDA